MGRSEAEDAGGLTLVKDDNKAAPHFTRRTLLVFTCFDYMPPTIFGNKDKRRIRGTRRKLREILYAFFARYSFSVQKFTASL